MKDSRFKFQSSKYALRLGLLLALVSALIAPPAASTPVAQAAADKIAPWVLAHTANGAPAEFLVVLADQADLSGADALSTKTEKGRYVYDALWQKAQATQKPILDWLIAQGVEHRSFYIVNLIWVRAGQDVALALAARSDVARVEGNPIIRNPLPAPGYTPEFNAPAVVEPNISYVNADDVWALGFTGQNIVVGGQDTGYEWDHPALISHYRGWDGATADHDYNWHDSIHSGGGVCGPDSPEPCDDNSHGTHTMGTAIGDDGGTNQIGVAPGAKWIGCRNMDEGVGTPTTYMECFEFFLAPYPVGGDPSQGDPALAPDVTTNSWSCPTFEGCSALTLQSAVEAQRAAGILTVVAATNSGPTCSTINDPPAIYDAAYSVGALNTGTDVIAVFSSRGSVDSDGSNRLKPDITAPGTFIRSSIPGGLYSNAFSGTSMATPHVAGVVALLWSARPLLTNQIDVTEQILNASATHISTSECTSGGGWPNNVYGYGRVDALAAVNSVPEGSGTLTGLISNELTAAPVAGAYVTATLSLTPTITGNVLTDGGGVYTQTLLPGVYTVTVTHPDYFGATLGGVSLTDGVTTTQNITLTPVIHSSELVPDLADQSGDPGRTVTYTLTLTNTGNYTDTFLITAVSDSFVTTVSPSLVGPLNIGASQTVRVTVRIPADAAPNTMETTTVTSISQGDPSATTTVLLTTTVNAAYGAAFAPALAQAGAPGSLVTHSLWLTNTGNLTDTFTVTAGSAVFTTTVLSPIVGPLNPGEGGWVTVTVQVPVEAVEGTQDEVTITATSQGAPSVSATATLTTQVALNRLYLPLVMK